MPKAEPDTLAKILNAGRREFLEKGFKDASLRSIAGAAGVTTGAIYGYYPDKGALFSALVEPAAGNFEKQFRRVQHAFTLLPKGEQIESMHSYSNQGLRDLLDYVYQNFDAFKLVLCRSDGTAYEGYVDTLVEVEAEATERFIAVLRQNGYRPALLRPNLIHILSSAYFSAIFETVAHDMDKAEADQYVEHLTDFFTAGWNRLLGLSRE